MRSPLEALLSVIRRTGGVWAADYNEDLVGYLTYLSGNLGQEVFNPVEFYQIAQTGTLYESGNLGNQPFERELRYVRQVANSAFRYSESIQRAYNDGTNQISYPMGHEPSRDGGLAFDIHYAVWQPGPVRMVLLYENGATARNLWNHYQEAGSHRLRFAPSEFFLSPGRYYYRLEAGGRAFTRFIAW